MADTSFVSCEGRLIHFALGRNGGAHLMQTTLQEHSDLHPDHVIVRLDFKNAFNTISRELIFEALLDLLDGQGAELLCIVNMLYGESAAELIYFAAMASRQKSSVVMSSPKGAPLNDVVLHCTSACLEKDGNIPS